MKFDYLESTSKKEIFDFEKKYDLHLPDDYRSFLEEFNGGISKEHKTFHIDKLNADIELDSLYGINQEKEWLDIGFWMEQFADELPENSVIIGGDVSDSMIVLLNSENEKGVFYWDSSCIFEQSNEDSNAYYIAATFTEFINMIGGVENSLGDDGKMKYLPLGSIVLLKGGVQKMIIISRAINVRNNGKTFFFDYGAVPYPEGLISDKMAYLNHDSISKIVFEGFHDDDDANMVENIHRYLDENPDIIRGDPSTWQS